ncbi:MAG: AraC family transcriptional regulator [Neisseriaceae bacterium]|nr:MAG: AraC family transcriptional regulator [Neisseriaceae bacterium]
METINIDSFQIIGISIKTANSDVEKLQHDMQSLWHRFISENIAEKIPNKISSDIYCIYTDYEGDYTKPYLALLGCRVENLDDIPTGLIGKRFNGGTYLKKTAKGNLFAGVVYDAWKEIWSMDIARTYHADFEIYGINATNPENAEVEILVGIQEAQ